MKIFMILFQDEFGKRKTKGSKMGKHIKTQLDYDMIEKFAKELHKLQPDNPVLQHYMSMENFEGAELRKSLKK